MLVRHTGIILTGPVVKSIVKSRYYYTETLSCGGTRVWNGRELKAGCNGIVENIIGLRGLIYCKHCDEWFNTKQFEEIEG